MIEIRFHGRGGQGSVIASRILAEAAFIEGKDVSAFPYFGVERRGAPVTAYTKIDTKAIKNKSSIYEPHFVIVLDPSLLKAVDVTAGLREGGTVLVNTPKAPDEVELDAKVATVNATQIAIAHGLGSKAAPIVNSAMLGAFVKTSGLVKIESMLESIKRNAPRKKDENTAAAQDAYDQVMI